ncbi:hypothetical protein AB0F17_62530 [Nonomuraea sp. NPDC026600]|uniref:hypothetical protein n=1 Tax=Nonomuraea sp. NPDC026600 TaxID=3155363 RepID=UPI0033F382AC
MSQFTAEEQNQLAAYLHDLDSAPNLQASVGASLEMPSSPGPGGLGQRVASAAGIGLPGSPAAEAGTIGPFDARIGFGTGVAVGGWANLALHSTGSFNFSGHFHVSGAISYDTSFIWAVRDFVEPNPNIYVFSHTGRVHGTFEPGSRDDDWGKSEINIAMRDAWGDLERRWAWRWEARVNADFGVFLDAIIKVVAAGQAVGRVISIVA